MELTHCINVILTVLGFKTAYCQQRQAYLTKSTGSECQTFPLGDPWTSVSPMACYSSCYSRYPETCRSIVYNTSTQSCTPGSTAFGPIDSLSSTIPDVNSGDDIYVLHQQIPECKTDLGFRVHDVCGTSACLFLSAQAVNHSAAFDACASMNSTLFIGSTEARFALYWYVSLNQLGEDTWLGLTDIAVEGQFVWGSGDFLSAWQDSYIWMPYYGIPDNARGEEHCVEVKHRAWPGVFGVNDIPCTESRFYICEP